MHVFRPLGLEEHRSVDPSADFLKKSLLDCR